MARHALIILMVVSIAAFGYRPSLAAMIPADNAAHLTEPASAEPISIPDVPEEMQKHDCCDRTDQQPTCSWDSACAARCHVNAGIATVSHMPLLARAFVQSVGSREAQSVVPKPPAPLLRPPIL